MNDLFDEARLLALGFSHENGGLVRRKTIAGGLVLITEVSPAGETKERVLDPDTGEPYTLHLTDAEGTFVGQVREECLAARRETEPCFAYGKFRFPQTRALLAYAHKRYGDDPEFLWAQYPDCAVLRRRETGKWYAVIMTVDGAKLEDGGEKDAEIADFHMDPALLLSRVDGKKLFPGWHMNKKHWATAILDGRLSAEELETLLDESYLLAK